MKLYFSYGSNMSRARLEERTGTVVPYGRARLDDYQHDFNHRGDDGSAKGNIAVRAGMQVHGVLYGLSPAQVDLLHPYEGGYEVLETSIHVFASGASVLAYTYTDHCGTQGLRPLASYIEHYMRGMLENDFPADYIATIVKQAGL